MRATLVAQPCSAYWQDILEGEEEVSKEEKTTESGCVCVCARAPARVSEDIDVWRPKRESCMAEIVERSGLCAHHLANRKEQRNV